MIRSKSIEHQLRNGRLDAKTRDSLFRRKIEEQNQVATNDQDDAESLFVRMTEIPNVPGNS